jgi:hypothetical protein
MALRIKDPIGRWWLDEGRDSGVWPCDVVAINVFGVTVTPTHEGSLYYGETFTVDRARVYDNKHNHPTYA